VAGLARRPKSFSRAELAGVRLTLRDYRAEFSAAQWSIGGQESWKLERQQHFREPGFESWEAFAQGDWERALELFEQERAFLAQFSTRAEDLGIGLYRVRVVGQPITLSTRADWPMLERCSRVGRPRR
jgi:hypothetical protein